MTSIRPRTATVTIYHGDDLERLSSLHLAAEVAARREATAALRIGDEVGDAQAKQDAYDTAAAEAAERATVIRVNAIGHKRFRSLLAEHPMRDGNDGDKALGANEDTFPEALILASVVEPDMSRAELVDLLDNLSEGEFEHLFATTYALNRVMTADPLGSRYSVLTPNTDETSDLPARLG